MNLGSVFGIARRAAERYLRQVFGAPVAATGATSGEALVFDGTSWSGGAAGIADTLTTKGDLLSFASDYARLGVGSDGQVLTAASGETTGLQWATPSSGGGTVQGTDGTYDLRPASDGVTAGSTARGENSVDLQTHRSAGTQVAAAQYSAILSGTTNQIASGSTGSVIAGGSTNSVAGTTAQGVIAGGFASTLTNGSYSVVSGGRQHSVAGAYQTVGGGFQCTISGAGYATVGGGDLNQATGSHSTVGGGDSNTATTTGSTVAGGVGNDVTTNTHGAIAGGQNNLVSGQHGFVGGGSTNTASGQYTVVCGGASNFATTTGAVCVGGASSTASGSHSGILGGSAHSASGAYSSITGGISCNASFENSRAGGYYAVARWPGHDVFRGYKNASITGSGQISPGTVTLGVRTTNATPTQLSTDGSTQLSIGQDNTFVGRLTVSAVQSGGANFAVWEGLVAVHYPNGGAATIVTGGRSSATPDFSAGTVTGWVLDVAIVSNVLEIKATGAAATNIQWGAKWEPLENTYL